MTNQRSARVIEVVEVVTLEGSGVPDDPYREVTSYFDFKGNPLATNDVASAHPGYWSECSVCRPDKEGVPLSEQGGATHRPAPRDPARVPAEGDAA